MSTKKISDIPITVASSAAATATAKTSHVEDISDSSQSIEEEIEELIEVSEELNENEDHSEKSNCPRSITKLVEAAGSRAELNSNGSGCSDAKFKIDDEQLVGGQLVQHFIISDDEEDDDDGDEENDNEVDDVDVERNDDEESNVDDFDISLPLDKNSTNSETGNNNIQAKPLSEKVVDAQENVAQLQPESLSNQSTSDDVSDFQIDDVRLHEEADTSLSNGLNKSNSLATENGSNESIEESERNSPVVSEKDHSIGEIIKRNHSIEISFHDTDISLLRDSFDKENDIVVNHLFSDITPSRRKIPKKLPVEAHMNKEMSQSIEMAIDSEQEKDATDTVKDIESFRSRPQLNPSDLSNLTSSTLFKALQKQQREVKQLLRISSPPSPLDETRSNNALCISEKVQQDNDDDDEALELMKSRILSLKREQQFVGDETTTNTDQSLNATNNTVKQMERIPMIDFNKDVLADITEESEQNSSSSVDEPHSISEDSSVSEGTCNDNEISETTPINQNQVSVEVLQKLEQQIKDLQQLLKNKDDCLAALNLKLEAAQNHRSSNGGSSEQPLSSSRDSSSLPTNSTEYRAVQEELGGGGAIADFYLELTKRDELVAKLTDSLQKSLTIRESLQAESERLNFEVQELRKQLSEATNTIKRHSALPPDQESNGGQRISEISMELISESNDDDDTDNHEFKSQLATVGDGKKLQNSQESRHPTALQSEANCHERSDILKEQMEQFQKTLTPNELVSFLVIQQKFNTFFGEIFKKSKIEGNDNELKIIIQKLEHEKKEKTDEIKNLQQQASEKNDRHAKEMEDLRKYFENKCTELEKQYSAEVSLKTQQLGEDLSSSEASEQEEIREEVIPLTTATRTKISAMRRRSRAELLLSPSHRQMTPGGDAMEESTTNIANEMADIKIFYQNKIHHLQRNYEEHLRKLNDRLKYFESRYPEDDFATNEPSHQTTELNHQSITTQVRDPNTSLIIIDQDELSPNNDSEIIQKIIEEYEKRLQEQLSLARNDIVIELENHIQALLADNTADDQYWPPELVLLREKFTAKSQLEIAQLQLKHEEEMSRLKIEYEKQLNRKNKRHSTFDLARDFDQIIGERDGLRELSKTFRHVLAELAKCVLNYEDDLNATLVDEMEKWLMNRSLENGPDGRAIENCNTSLNCTVLTETNKYMPDVHNLLEVIEDPDLKDFVGNKNSGDLDDFDLNDCLEKLKAEAAYLLQLSEAFLHRRQRRSSDSSGVEKNDSCCEVENGLKTTAVSQPENKTLRANSLNEQQLVTQCQMTKSQHQQQHLNSLPPNLNRLQTDDSYSPLGVNASELNFQVHELKNRLVKSETDRLKLRQDLENNIRRNNELVTEMQTLRDQLARFDSLNRTEYVEDCGLGTLIKSPQREAAEKSSANFSQLQERARNILSTPTQQQKRNETVVLLQMIEDFCREGDKVIELNRKDREDLQAQIIAADKQLRAIRQFLEEQAVEREQERDEFVREIEHLKTILRDKEKERSNYEHASKEVEHQESQLHQLDQKLEESNAKCDKLEMELKASIDKIFVLREIITELETQVETKTLNEQTLQEKVKQLEHFISSQTRSNDTLQHELQSLKGEICENYQERIRHLEEKLQNTHSPAEQNVMLDQIVEQLRDIELTLDEQTKTLETLHNSSNSCSLTVTEDISARGCGTRPSNPDPVNSDNLPHPLPTSSPLHPSLRLHALSVDSIQRIIEKLSKHTRVEEAAVKRMRDFEMQINKIKGACLELEQERDSLHERMSEQMQRISVLQSRLEEQRQRAEEMQRASTCDLNIRIHDLQGEVQTLRETLTSREKQIANMRQQLEKSKNVIDRLEAELAAAQQNPERNAIERLEKQLQQRDVDVQMLKEKLKSEMLNHMALPDLMETILADKNEEIDLLKQQLEAKERDRQTCAKEETNGKLSARTLSDILSISEFDEPDVIRRAEAAKHDTPLMLAEVCGNMQETMETSKEVVANLTHRRLQDLDAFARLRPTNTFDNPHYFQDNKAPVVSSLTSASSGSSLTPALVPRHINFSALTDDRIEKSTTPSRDADAFRLLEEQSAAKILALQQQVTEAENNLVVAQQQLCELQKQLHSRETELAEVQKEDRDLNKAQLELASKCVEIEKLLEQVSNLIADRKLQSETITKQEKDLANYRQNEVEYLRRLAQKEEKIAKSGNELEMLHQQFKDLQMEHDQCKVIAEELTDCKDKLNELNQEIKGKNERLLTLTAKLSVAEDTSRRNQQQVDSMKQEIEKLHSQQQQQQQQQQSRQQSSDNSSRQLSVDEIARQLENELNYSAQLDSNILKAIESEEENNLDASNLSNKQSAIPKKDASIMPEQHVITDDENFIGERDLLNQLEVLRTQIAVEREQTAFIRQELQTEKLHSQELQEQDVLVIEAMRMRLEKALTKEDELHKLLDQERDKCERLQTQLTVLQRSDSRRTSALAKSPNDSPRRSPRFTDFDSDLAERLRGEIKLLTAQQERERERHADLQHNLERERTRFETELQDRIAYSDRLKQEMERMGRDKELAEQEAEHLQERLLIQAQEIESLEARIANLQEAETRRVKRRDQQIQENAQNVASLQELKVKLEALETERDNLMQTVTLLRCDLERSASRESKLAETLARINSNSTGGGNGISGGGGEASIPQQFLQKMKDINTLLAENTKENRQMAETVQFLVEERRQLQKKCEELEQKVGSGSNARASELEERCNHLLGRYLRVESHRKALVYQKRYLKISLQSYQESETRALTAMNGGIPLEPYRDKRRMFKIVALAVIAIQRMKFIGRIWHTGKRIVSKSVFTITQQKRSQPPTISCPAVSSTVLTPRGSPPTPTSPRYNLMEQRYAPLEAPTLLSEMTARERGYDNNRGIMLQWPRSPTRQNWPQQQY